ncbi:hypothetical protein [Bacillus safensis]|uniref:hypothetical protein n=1 Tax=Bacillus safensis TaxID=561879 RepID=UPI0038394AB5
MIGKQNENIIVYSKKDGVNRFLPIITNDLISLTKVIGDQYPKEKDFIYILVQGVEIKLF